MNLSQLQVEIRQRSVGQVVAVATRLLQHRPWPLLFCWALYSLPLLALALGLTVYQQVDPWSVWLWLLLSAPVFSLPLVTTAGHLVFSPSVRLTPLLVASLRRSATFLLLFVGLRLVTMVGLSALIVPGLFLWRGSWFLAPIVTLEGASPSASLKRARHFAAGFHGTAMLHMLNAAGILIYWSVALATLGHFLIKYVVGLNLAVVGDLARAEHYHHLLGMAGFALAVPFVSLVWFFAYLDIRTRKEGWDLELTFRRKAAALESASAK